MEVVLCRSACTLNIQIWKWQKFLSMDKETSSLGQFSMFVPLSTVLSSQAVVLTIKTVSKQVIHTVSMNLVWHVTWIVQCIQKIMSTCDFHQKIFVLNGSWSWTLRWFCLSKHVTISCKQSNNTHETVNSFFSYYSLLSSLPLFLSFFPLARF